ncbi:MAG: SDR family oxidoreductase [Pseudomonadota bacterium]
MIMILLTGSTGLTGQHVAKAVAATGNPVRALVRDLKKAEDLAALGVDVVQGDLADEASIAAAMDGIDKAFLLMANGPEQRAHEIRFIDAAKAAGVSHLVKLSAIGVEAGHFNKLKDTHGRAEDHLKSSGLAYTILRGNFFMQYMLYFMPAIEATGAFYVPADDRPMGMVDVRDIADCAAKVLTQDGHAKKTYLLTGPALHTFADAAQLFSSALGKDVACTLIPADAFKAQMMKTGQDEWTASAVTEEFELLAGGGGEALTQSVEQITDHPPRSFAALLKETFGG